MKKGRSKIWKIMSIGGLALLSIILWNNLTLQKATKGKVFSKIETVPPQTYGVILGTSKTARSGKNNHYFFNRIDAAVRLIESKKIDTLIISGDHKNKDYNEIADMKEALLERGISPSILLFDPKGFDTYSSMKNMKKWVKSDTFVVISQKFHNQRAVFIAEQLELQAIGYNAKDVQANYGFLTSLREHFARLKMRITLLFD